METITRSATVAHAVGIPVERMVGRLVPERATGDVVLREIAAMHAAGVRTLRANVLAERLWPGRRQHNANGQVYPLGAAIAARLLRRCPAVREKEYRLWEILPHRLPANVKVEPYLTANRSI